MKTWHDPTLAAAVRARDPRHRRRKGLRFLTAAAATLLILLGLESGFPSIKHRVLKGFRAQDEDAGHPTALFNWDSIRATKSLEFHPCYFDFGPHYECAKLEVPLDYFNGTYPDATISIAITKLAAKVSVDDPRYGGPVLVNPGGPGGSGVSLALGWGQALQTIIDPAPRADGLLESRGKYYDVLGFDPRGIGFTEPAARCMPDLSSAWSWRLRESTEGMLGSSDAALGRLWSMSHAFGASCKQGMNAEDGPDILQYMSTASVARDMLQIAEKHAEWADAKATQLATEKHSRQTKCHSARSTPQYEPGTVKLHYWGFSYGTYLGATFASMFPDQVGRLILDGVVNVHDYNHALGQGSLHDTEKDMSSFYTFCLLSGPEICPLTTPTSSARDIEKRVQKIVDSLYHRPLVLNSPSGPEILTYTDLKGIIFSSLYTPAVVFPVVAKILAAVENGGGDILDQIAGGFRPAHIYSCSINGSSFPLFFYEEVQLAILCGDGIDQTSLDMDTFAEYWQLLHDISPSAGDLWAIHQMKCAAWNINAVYKWGDDDRFGGNTSHPILWISNTADPVTPLNSGRIMARRFPGSVVMVQDSPGHCSLSTPTPCTIKIARDYFQTGTLPDHEVVCIPPVSPLSLNSTDPNSPFYDPSLGQALFVAEEGLEEEMEAARKLQLWTAGNKFMGRGHLSERVNGMIANSVGFIL